MGCPDKGHPQPGPVRGRTGLRAHYGFALGAPTNPYLLDYAHVSLPCGSGFVQFLVTPSWVITTLAVADPSNVMTSLRDVVDGAEPSFVTVAVIERVTVPAVG